ncbi:MAG: bifunctional diaminohydroxyphosphoribosylaminopyrimidine deaminase/5-amino-6-(5-phosphoribosylamino)uracil reductase RibD, partial [Phycisphaeraceae bacterium]
MTDLDYMLEAIDLARRGEGWVEPNPMVGAVVVRGGEVVGRGWHGRFGGPHAEVEALADARRHGHDPAGATMYVTLEPCSHQGKTPPCADALVRGGLARVVVAMRDPFEKVAGRGIARLREAGIRVEVGVAEEQAARLTEPFVKRVTTGLPWVVLKWAQTLDGRIATASGDSKWISSPASRQRVHELRSRVDAVMVGIGTAIADDPQLTARGVEVRRQARRVVVDPGLHLPRLAKLLAGDGPPVIVAARQAVLSEAAELTGFLRDQGAELIGLPPRGGGQRGVSLRPLLEHLASEHEATRVLVEGGAGLAGALLREGLADQVLAFVAPKLLGDKRGVAAVRGRDVEKMSDAWPLELCEVERIGDDVLLNYRV